MKHEDLMMWKYTEGTHEVRVMIQTAIVQAERAIIDFGGLMGSQTLERDYCRAVGYIDGLKYIDKLLKPEEIKDEQTRLT